MRNHLVWLPLASVFLFSCSNNENSNSPAATPDLERPNTSNERPEPASQPANGKSIPSIPSSFRGEWRQELSSCGSDADDSILVISENELSYWESISTPQSIVQTGSSELVVEVLSEGEGETWNSTLQMVLSENGKTLTIKDGDFSFDRYRCPTG